MGDDEDDEGESSDEENEDPRAKTGKGKPSLGKRKTMASRFEAQPKNRRKPKRASPSSSHPPPLIHILVSRVLLTFFVFLVICSGSTNRNRVRERDGAGEEGGCYELVVYNTPSSITYSTTFLSGASFSVLHSFLFSLYHLCGLFVLLLSIWSHPKLPLSRLLLSFASERYYRKLVLSINGLRVELGKPPPRVLEDKMQSLKHTQLWQYPRSAISTYVPKAKSRTESILYTA